MHWVIASIGSIGRSMFKCVLGEEEELLEIKPNEPKPCVRPSATHTMEARAPCRTPENVEPNEMKEVVYICGPITRLVVATCMASFFCSSLHHHHHHHPPPGRGGKGMGPTLPARCPSSSSISTVVDYCHYWYRFSLATSIDFGSGHTSPLCFGKMN